MKKNTPGHDVERYKRANRLVLRHYWRETKRNWKTSLPGLFLPSLNTILISYVPPLAIASIVSMATSQKNPDFNDFVPYILLFGGAWLLGEIVMRIAIYFMIKSETAGIKNLYDDGISQLLERDIDFFNNNFAGALTKKTIGYANRYVDIFDTVTFNIISKVVPIIFASIVLFTYSPWLVVVLLSWIGGAIAVALPLIRNRRKLVTDREIASNIVGGHIADTYSNIAAVRAHASEQREEERSRKYVLDLANKLKASWSYQNNRVDIAIAPFNILANVSGLALGLYLAQKGTISYAEIIVVFSYYMLVTGFMWEFNAVYKKLEAAISDAAQYTELLLTKPTILDPEHPEHIKIPKGAIAFDNVHFSYEEDGKNLFEEFDLSIPAGQKVGLVGRSGGGKTSITKLLLRFVDIHDGTITIDGVPINKLTQKELRSLISYVPQEPVMFHRTISENIAYGKPGATEKEILGAAKKAHAHEFVKDLPNGYETLVGERGVKLSGGQRQRIAIARAMLKNAPILLLDEATSALDSESENLIQDALWKLMEGKTTLVIAHRLSTIQKMDRIVVLDKGTIIEQGTHAELNDHGGIYAELWKHQSGGFIED